MTTAGKFSQWLLGVVRKSARRGLGFSKTRPAINTVRGQRCVKSSCVVPEFCRMAWFCRWCGAVVLERTIARWSQKRSRQWLKVHRHAEDRKR